MIFLVLLVVWHRVVLHFSFNIIFITYLPMVLFLEKKIKDLYMVYFNSMCNYINFPGVVRSSGKRYMLTILTLITSANL